MLDCLPYIAVFALTFMLNVLFMQMGNKPLVKKLLISSSFLVLLFFIGFRYSVGTDYDNYLSLYNSISDVAWDKLPFLNLELFVAILFKLCSIILPDPRLIFVVLGGLMLYPIYKANRLYDYKYLAYSVLTFCILFLPFGLNGMRQGIAMGFALLSIIYFVRNDVKKGILNLMISTLFHMSAFLIAPYLLLIWVYNNKNIRFTALNIFFTMFFSVMILFFLNDLLMDGGFTKYNYVLGNIDTEKISFNGLVFYIPILLLMFFKDKKHKKEISVYKNLIVSSMIFLVIGTSAQYLTRFALYFMMPAIIVLPMLIQNISQKNTRIMIKVSFIVFLMTFFYVQYFVQGRHEIMPYQTWLFSSTHNLNKGVKG